MADGYLGKDRELTQADIDQRVFDLYDEYCHGRIDRRSFLQACGAIAGGLAMAQALLPNYAKAQTIAFTDARMRGRYVSYPSPGGSSGTQHGFHNDSTPRFQREAASLAWDRTVAFFRTHLA